MKTLLTGFSIVIIALLAGCQGGPPKTPQETQAEANSGETPDNLRDQRPAAAPMGPLFMPMR